MTGPPKLKRTRLATEAQYLLARYVFEEMEYRCYEWKRDASISRQGGQQSGLVSPMKAGFVRLFVYKGCKRDTDWLSMIDKDWPGRQEPSRKMAKPRHLTKRTKALSDF